MRNGIFVCSCLIGQLIDRELLGHDEQWGTFYRVVDSWAITVVYFYSEVDVFTGVYRSGDVWVIVLRKSLPD